MAWRVSARPEGERNSGGRADGPLLEVSIDHLERDVAHRNEPSLVALAPHRDDAALPIEVGHLERAKLGDAQPARIQKVKHRRVARAARRLRVRASG